MSRVAFLFPGQGTQHVGMAMDLADHYPQAAAQFEQANDVMHMDIRRLCREGPESELLKTEISQPTIHTATLAILKVVQSYGFASQVTGGFSLGEYAALVHAGVMRFEDSVKLVRQRGLFMQEAVPQGLGKMCWITGLARPVVEAIVAEAGALGLIECSNFNCPQQIIVAGLAVAVERAAELAGTHGATAITFLNVSGPFHTSLLAGAGQRLGEVLAAVPLGQSNQRIVSNVTARYLSDEDDIRALLCQHVYKPVRWEECINTLLDDGVDTLVEIGPKHLLTGYHLQTVRERGSQARCLNVENMATLQNFLREMGSALRPSA